MPRAVFCLGVDRRAESLEGRNKVRCTCILPAAGTTHQFPNSPSSPVCAFSALLVQRSALSVTENALHFVASQRWLFVHGLPAYQRAGALGNVRTIAEPFEAPYRRPQTLIPRVGVRGGHVAKAFKVCSLLFPITLCLCGPWRNKTKTISV